MQRLILCHDYEINEKINSLLSEGFLVVPNTTVIFDAEVVKDSMSYSRSTTPSNTVFQVMISVVLEKVLGMSIAS